MTEISALPLREAVLAAVEANEEAKEIYCGADGWRSVVFEFVRLLRGHQQLFQLEAGEAADLIEAELKALGRDELLPYSHDETDPWGAAFGDCDSAGSEENAAESFLTLWPKMNPNRTMAAAAARARVRVGAIPADTFGPDLSHPRRYSFRTFLLLCAELAAAQPSGVFVLSVEAAAEALHTDRKVTGGWRREALERGLLVEVEAPINRKRAGRYAPAGVLVEVTAQGANLP